MSIWRLFTCELLFRRWSFLLAVLSVVVAVGCLVAELTILRLHETASHVLLAEKEHETGERIEREQTKTIARLAKFEAATKLRLAEEQDRTMKALAKLEDDYRKTTKKLGFNILIVSAKENIALMDYRNFATESMPEAYVQKLAKSKIMTINHLLPMIQEEVEWPGIDNKILLCGVRGEVPLMHAADEKKPLMEAVPAGKVVLGHFVHKHLGVKEGDRISYRGKDFTVHKLHPYRKVGKEDWTVWMNLDEAQVLLDRKGKINVIWALECNCASEDRLAEIRAEVKQILPDTEVLEVYTAALVRAEARERAKKEFSDGLDREKKKAQAVLAQEKKQAAATLTQERTRATEELQAMQDTRHELGRQLSGFAALLIPLVLVGSIVWLGVMTLNNVREREGEIGILRALGLSSGSVFILFITRAVLVGLVGALVGYGLGLVAGGLWAENDLALASNESLFDPALLLIIVLAAPAICAMVGWMAALAAAKQDPAIVLQQS